MSSFVQPHVSAPAASTGPANDAAAPRQWFGGLAFDWAMSLLGMVFLGGLFLDGWAHNHGRVDQTFFTPWHAFFYGGFMVIVLLLVATMWLNHARGVAWPHVLPAGYSLTVLGALIFAAGGVGDLIWHETFGVEADFDALFSPSHLVLATGLSLVLTGPLRAAWVRPSRRLTWRTAVPALLSLTALISSLTFMLMATHPLANSVAGRHHGYGTQIGQLAGTASILLTTVLLLGPTLLTLRRWHLPAGSLILVWGINTLAMFWVNWEYADSLWHALAMLVAIVVIDAIRVRLEPLCERPRAFRIFAGAAPFLLFAGYFTALLLTEGTQWSIHLWTGIIVEAGIAGWLLSYLVLPPAAPEAMLPEAVLPDESLD